MWWGYWVLGLTVSAFAYIVYVGVSAFLDTKSAPRKPMHWCDKHGAMMEEYMIDFVGQKICSICFHEKMKTAEEAGKFK